MRILHLVHQYWPFLCGSARYFQLPSEYLAAKGHEVTVFTTDALEYDYFLDRSKKRARKIAEVHNGVNIRRFRTRHLPKKVRNLLHYHSPSLWAKCLFGIPFVPGMLLASLRKYDFDIVHGGILPYGILLYTAREIALRNHIPLIMSPHLHIGEPDNDEILKIHSESWQIDMLRDCDLIFTQTNLEKEKLATFGMPESTIEVLGNGISMADLSGGEEERFKRKYGITSPIVLFLGTKAYDKGATHVVKASEILWKSKKQFTLVLAGSSSNRDFTDFYRSCSDTVRKNTLNLHNIPEDEKKDLLAATEVLAMPSRNEAFGVTYLEAWAYKKPVIGAIAGGVPDVISDGVDGFLVPFAHTDELAHKLDAILEDHDLARRMGESGYKKLIENFTIDKKLEILEKAYQRLFESRHKSKPSTHDE